MEVKHNYRYCICINHEKTNSEFELCNEKFSISVVDNVYIELMGIKIESTLNPMYTLQLAISSLGLWAKFRLEMIHVYYFINKTSVKFHDIVSISKIHIPPYSSTVLST